MVSIQEGAIFVADAHYPHHGDDFFSLLVALDERKITTPQLFLMGDIFDLLFGHNDFIIEFYRDSIPLLQKLSNSIDIYYFEGNHDFCLEDIFPNINVFPRTLQPIIGSLGEKKVGLSHGDKYEVSKFYDLYCLLLRNKWSLMFLRPFQKKIILSRMSKLKQKNICIPMDDFAIKAKAILKNYDGIDLIIEGHYHQSIVIDKRYISLPSLACNGKIGFVKKEDIEFIPWTTLL